MRRKKKRKGGKGGRKGGAEEGEKRKGRRKERKKGRSKMKRKGGRKRVKESGVGEWLGERICLVKAEVEFMERMFLDKIYGHKQILIRHNKEKTLP